MDVTLYEDTADVPGIWGNCDKVEAAGVESKLGATGAREGVGAKDTDFEADVVDPESSDELSGSLLLLSDPDDEVDAARVRLAAA